MRRRVFRVLVPVVAVGLVAGLVASGRFTAPTPSIVGPPAGGHGGDPIDPPLRLTEGDFSSSLTTLAVLEAGASALTADRGKTAAVGPIGGIVLRAEDEQAPECEAGYRDATDDEIAAHAIPTPAYLPAGAFEYEEQSGVACGGSVRFVQRRFILEPEQATIVVIRWFRTKEVRAQASLERVTEARIGDREAVLIEPVTASGYGNSWVFVHEGDGLLQLSGVNVPFDELLSVAKGVS